MLPNAIMSGISQKDFWDMTYGEIHIQIDTFNKAEIRRMTEKAFSDYTLAHLIGRAASTIMSKDAKYPTFEEAYPNIMELNGTIKKDEVPKQQDWELMKARMLDYSGSHNGKLKKKGVEIDGSRGTATPDQGEHETTGQ